MISLFTPAVIVAALGYFVDIFDLLLFSIVRKSSLMDLGITGDALISQGLFLHNLQMFGMLVGGVLWGVMGDKRGRLSVLFGSIILYSIGNILNAFVWDVPSYAVCRLISGLGLAGELGAGITLVSETLPKEKRGYGTMIVATIGVTGAIFAGVVGEFFHWRTTYIIGGLLGFLLLLLRIKTKESFLFQHALETNHSKGNFFTLFTNLSRFKRFFHCILVGVPIWYVIGTLIQLSPELSKILGVTGDVVAGRSIIWNYSGLVFGDFMSGFISQKLRSRKKVLWLFITGLLMSVLIYFFTMSNASTSYFYFICFVLGFFAGYWAIFVTISAEQFGTNMRATVATSSPNFVRAAVIPISLGFTYLNQFFPINHSALTMGLMVIAISFISLISLRETFHLDLNYYEDC